MNDLAYSPPKRDTPEAAMPSPMDGSGPSYPSLNLNGEQAGKAGLTKCAHGDEYEITLKIRAKRIGGYGDEGDKPSVEFDVLAADAPKAVTSEEAEPDDEKKDDKKDEKPKRKPKSRVKSPADFDL